MAKKGVNIRVVPGDSLELIPKYLEPNSIDLVATDPP